MVYFSIMKQLLLFGFSLVIVIAVWGQQKKEANSVMSMQQYLDSVKKKNEAQLKTPLDLLKKKQPILMQEQFRPKIIMPAYVNKNVMPVLSPDSSYVYNMPGTHAFDKSKAKGGAIFVGGNMWKLPAAISEKK